MAWSTPGGTGNFPSSSFFDPNFDYGADRDWLNTPLGSMLREQNPEATYGLYGYGMGIRDNDTNFSNWFYQQFPRFQRAYEMATLTNPMITIDDFLATLPNQAQMQHQYRTLSPQQRGEQPGLYAPVSRWIPR